ncbi:unnamed protein product [Prorocentrum cordatum]|uniref:Uncharacterized protein n=1 Tax=Prorocentrum cordatum TaxID=2364126 RepID=A0ABN9PF99_9DINO|nr:unnamed protein product [Polarella glacialis]
MYTWRDPCCPRHRSHPSSECGNAGEGRCICTMPREHSKQQEGAEAHISPLSRRGTERAVLDRANMQQACTLQTSPHNAPRKSLQQRQEEEEEEEKEEKGQRRVEETGTRLALYGAWAIESRCRCVNLPRRLSHQLGTQPTLKMMPRCQRFQQSASRAS